MLVNFHFREMRRVPPRPQGSNGAAFLVVPACVSTLNETNLLTELITDKLNQFLLYC